MADRVELGERDVAILELLLVRRAETLAALHARFFANATLKTARNRLHRLQQGRYLEREAIPLDRDSELTSVYMLGPRARAALLRHSCVACEAFAGHGYNATRLVTSLPQRIALNRVGDWLGTELHDRHPLAAYHAPERNRPAAVYEAATADWDGRSLVFVEIDHGGDGVLGHHSRERLLGKVGAFFDSPYAARLLIAAPTRRRARAIAVSIRARYGENVQHRIQILTFDELRDGGYLQDGYRPAPDEHSRDAS